MRPIELKIKGLNSFVEEQIIDFEKLTSRGLFGIFGPTGSGKTTILDGITLSLYGDISRSTKEFINANEEAAFVSFEFVISGSVSQRYRVEREFRRSKSGGITTKNARILTYENGETIVLEDRPAKVDEQCESIIGLKKEDFTRTVVLPQGKFSDFLKLKNKDRGEMLERLFNLQQYGDELTAKMSVRAKKVRQQESELSGQLKAFADVSVEAIEADEAALALKLSEQELAQKDYKKLEKEVLEAEDIWKIQKELVASLEKMNVQLEETDAYKLIEHTIAQAETASRLMPQVSEFERLRNSVLELSETELKQQVELVKLRNTHQIEAEKFDALHREREEKLPRLQKEETQFEAALLEKKALQTTKTELENMEADLKKLTAQLTSLQVQIKTDDDVLKNTQAQIQIKTQLLEPLKLPASYKGELTSLHHGLEQLEGKQKQAVKLNEKITAIESSLKAKQLEFDTTEKQLLEVSSQQSKEQLKLKALEENNLGDSEILVQKSKEFQDIKSKWIQYGALTEQISKAKGSLSELSITMKKHQEHLDALSLEKSLLTSSIDVLNIEEKAEELRKVLADGEACPVCGALSHPFVHAYSSAFAEPGENEQALQALQKRLHELELSSRELENNQIEDRTKAKQFDIQLMDWERDLKALGETFLEHSLTVVEEAYEQFEMNWKAYHQDLKQQQTICSTSQEQLSKCEQALGQLESVIKTVELEYKGLEAEKNELSLAIDLEDKALNVRKEKLGIQNIREKFSEMQRYEQQAEILETELNTLRSTLKTLEIKLNQIKDQFQESQKRQVELSTQFNLIRKNAQEKKVKLEESVGSLSLLEAKMASIQSEMSHLNGRHKEQLGLLNQLGETLKKLEDAYLTTCNHLKLQQENAEQAGFVLNNLLELSGFESSATVKESYLEASELSRLKSKVQNYQEEVHRLNGVIAQLKSKLAGRQIEESVYLLLLSSKGQASEALQLLSEQCVALKTGLEQLKQRFLLMKDLILEKGAVDLQLAYVSDLEKLFQGKRFVAYIAANQLKYISGKASEQLLDISLGNYGIETDDEGNFMIRDFKNGGVLRDPSTLSGGETFMVSLALALALSAQIQLKGTAPLEFFFLDEGFGTLDEDTLEVVMSALERLHHEKLSIGLISHVESIKNRVPIKLVLTPAKAGLGGSKVKVELS